MTKLILNDQQLMNIYEQLEGTQSSKPRRIAVNSNPNVDL